MKTVNKDMIIADIIAVDPGVAAIFFNAGMGCAGCPSAAGETLVDAGIGHGIDVDKLVDDINAYLATLEA